MTDRGNIYSPWAGRAKEYAWNLCLDLAPRAITPTDIDYMVECNGHFLFFEMKTVGARMPYGQELAFTRLLRALSPKAVLLVVEHPPVSRVVIPNHINSFEIIAITKRGTMKRMLLEKEHFIGVYAAFFRWAEGDTFALYRAVHGNRSPAPTPVLQATAG